TRPTTVSTWPLVLTPDALKDNQQTIDGQYYSVAVDTGELLIRHALPTYNAAVAPLTLAFSSLAADREPIFISHYTLDPAQSAAPPTVSAQLFIRDITNTTTYYTGQKYYYDTSLLNPGDIMEIALQATGVGSLATGRYAYEIDEIANYATPVATTMTGPVNLV